MILGTSRCLSLKEGAEVMTDLEQSKYQVLHPHYSQWCLLIHCRTLNGA